MTTEEYENLLTQYSNVCDELHDILREKENQIRSLEAQLKNAIVPKFKLHTELFVIASNKIEQYYIDEIVIRTEDNLVQYHDTANSIFITENNELFATREDAEKRLAELKGDIK